VISKRREEAQAEALKRRSRSRVRPRSAPRLAGPECALFFLSLFALALSVLSSSTRAHRLFSLFSLFSLAYFTFLCPSSVLGRCLRAHTHRVLV
jgi:threonine/homoserine/homoserine lactone efflux protein